MNPPAARFEEGGQRGILKRGGAAFRSKKNIESMTLTVQKEVAERIVAKPGGKDYGVLSIMVQYHAKPRLEFIIPKEAFRPVPKVDSAVIHIEILDKPSVDVLNEEIFSRVVKTAFSQRRKMLSNSLRSLREDVKEWLSKAGIDPNRRPETLSIEEFARLANIYLIIPTLLLSGLYRLFPKLLLLRVLRPDYQGRFCYFSKPPLLSILPGLSTHGFPGP